jgi:hypothetical protein
MESNSPVRAGMFGVAGYDDDLVEGAFDVVGYDDGLEEGELDMDRV